MNGTPLPTDILLEVERLFLDPEARAAVLHLFHEKYTLNVSRDPLLRAVLFLCGGDLGAVREAFESTFGGDPRDYLLLARQKREARDGEGSSDL